jgi:hypothetical protein
MTEEGGATGQGAATAAGRTEHRRRGRKPADADERRRKVLAALADLEAARVPFTMGDLAERAGISRATLYRDAGLRDLVGDRGDSPDRRPVNVRDFEKLRRENETLAEERRDLKKRLRDAEKRYRESEERVERLLDENTAHERARRDAEESGETGPGAKKARDEAYKEGFAAGYRAATSRPGAGGPGAGAARPNTGGRPADANLAAVAARLPQPALQQARRKLARVLHPDLFAKDPAAAMIATELLKQLNALAGGTTGRGQ